MKFLKHYLLLISLIFIILSSPFLEEVAFGGIISLVLICVSSFLCLLVLSLHRRVFRVMLVFAILVMGGEILNMIFPTEVFTTIQFGNLTLLFLLFAGILFFALMTSRSLSFSDISNAVSVYILLGIGFGFLYGFIERIHPGAITSTASGTSDTGGEMIYFSFIVLTTVGFGDMLPAIKLTRVLAMFEAVLGVLYIAIMIGRLVGTVSPKEQTNKSTHGNQT